MKYAPREGDEPRQFAPADRRQPRTNAPTGQAQPRRDGAPSYGPRPPRDGGPGGSHRPQRDGSQPNRGPRPQRDGASPNYGPRPQRDGAQPNRGPRPQRDGAPSNYGPRPQRDGAQPNRGPRPPRDGARDRGHRTESAGRPGSETQSSVVDFDPNKRIIRRAPGEDPSRRFVTTREGKAERVGVSFEDPCRILAKCGSCPMLEVPYKAQLQSKTADLRARAKDAGFAESIVRDCVGSDDRMGYRHTAKLVASERVFPDGMAWFDLGLYKPGTHDVVDIAKCPVQQADLNDVSGYVRGAVRTHGVSVYNPRTRSGSLRYVVIRRGRKSRQILVTFVCGKDERGPLRAMARELSERFPRVQGVLLHLNDTEGNTIFRPNLEEEQTGRDVVLAGRDWIEDEVAGMTLRISSGSFAQVNPAVAERMYFRVVDLLDPLPGETALDLYCGVGGITLLLAERAAKAVGVEESEAAIADARQNAESNDCRNADFYVGRVEEALTPGGPVDLGKVDLVSLNPSRRGCQPAALERIAALKPRAISYMSCNPETLMRDLSQMANLGYVTKLLEPHDMFPGSPHYEVLALLMPK